MSGRLGGGKLLKLGPVSGDQDGVMTSHQFTRGGGGVVLVAVASGCFSLGCTKVIEQPQAAPPPPPSALQEPTPPPANEPAPARKSWGLIDRGGSAGPARLRESLNDDGQGLNRTQLNTAIQAVLPGLAPCFVGTPENNAMVTFEADPNGSPRAVTVTGVNAAAQTCIRDLISSVQFPRFKGNAVPISYPLSVHRTENPAPPPQAAPPPPPPSSAAGPAPSPTPAPAAAVAPPNGQPTTGTAAPPSAFVTP